MINTSKTAIKIIKKKYALTLMVFLSSIGFLNPMSVFSDQLVKLFFYLSILIALFVAVRNKPRRMEMVRYPQKVYYTFLGALAFSTVMVYLFQNQSYQTTLIATLPFFLAYFFLFIFIRFSLSKELIINVITVLCVVGMVSYVVNLVAFPQMIFDVGRSEMDDLRGIRINIPFIELDVLMFLYSINQYIKKRERKWLIRIVLFMVFIVLSVTRQIILFSFVFGLLLCLQKASVFKKLLLVAGAFFIYAVVLPQIPLYRNMMELSEEQAEKNQYEDEDIRIQAWRFFTSEYQTNSLTGIFGNGVPSFGNSPWGNKVQKTIYIDYGGNGCYQADVGWAGFYWYFGLIATVCLVLLFVKAVKIRKEGDCQYINYWLMFILVTSLASGPIIYQNQILSIMAGLYLAYSSRIP